MAAFSGFRPFLTKGSTINGAQNTLFTNDVNGVYYLPKAADVYGTTALATFNEGISGVLDEKNGVPVFGPNLIVNGDFSNGTTGWTGYTSTISVVNGRLRVVSLDNDTRFAGQSVTTVPGKTYELSFDYDCGTATNIAFAAGSALGANNFLPYTLATGSGTIKRLFTVTSTPTFLYFGGWTNNAGKEYFFDNISVKELSGSPSVQTTVSARPLLGRAPKVRRNVLSSSQDFSNASYNKQSTTLTANAGIAPDGTNTATLYSSTNRMYWFDNTAAIGNKVHTFYAKKEVGNLFTVQLVGGMNLLSGSSTITVNLDTGAVTTGQPITSVKVTASTNGFWKIVIYLTVSYSYGNSTYWQITTSTGMYIWGFQLESGTVETSLQTVVNNIDVTESGAILYPFIRSDLSDDVLTTNNIVSTKNLFRYTEEFDDNYWKAYSAVTVTSNTTTAPDGSLTADTIAASSATANNGAFQNTIAIPNGSSVSFYAKRGTVGWVAVGTAFTAFTGWFNLDTGTTGSSSNCTTSMINAGNGWWRCCLSNITVGASRMVISPKQSGGTGDSWSVGVNAIGDNIYLWGVQLELNSAVTDYVYGGLKGTVVVAGRDGTAIDSITLPNGVFSLGPASYTGGTPGILRAVGDIVGYSITGKSTTSAEQEQLIDLYKSRGAKGKLIQGSNLVQNGNFSSGLTGWSSTPTTGTFDITSNVLRITATQNISFPTVSIDVPYTLRRYHLLKFTIPAVFYSGYGPVYASASHGGGTGFFVGYYGVGTHSIVSYASPAYSAFLRIGFGISRNAGAPQIGDWGEVTNVELYELRPKEEW